MASFTNLTNFDLALTLTPGQAFRWEERGGWFYGVVEDRALRARQLDDSLIVESNQEDGLEEFVRDYFQIGVDYDAVLAAIATDEHMARAVEGLHGLRMLRQPPWECLISFILTINNNVPRILKMIQALARNYGHPLQLGDYHAYSFPTPSELAASCEVDMRLLRMGYRSRAICEAATRVLEEGLSEEHLRSLPYEDVKSYLMSYHGVGEKVADCIALFSLDKTEAFPVDVWIKRVIEQLYFGGKELKVREIHAFAAERWGRYAGYAQHFLYYYARNQVLSPES